MNTDQMNTTQNNLQKEQERLFTIRCNAVITRDSSFSNSFVYSVTGQKNYCRPDCPVLEVKNGIKPIFFGTHEEAESKGYKPCEHCRPELKVKVSDEIVDNTIKLVNRTLGLGEKQKEHKQEQNTALQVSTELSERGDDGLSNVANYMPELTEGFYNHARSNSTSNSPILPSEAEFQNWRPRRASIANGHIPAFSAAVAEMTSQVESEAVDPQNQQSSDANNSNGFPSVDFAATFSSNSSGDHARLVNRACRQLAAAAAAEVTISAVANSEDSRRSSVSSSGAGVNGVGHPPRPIAVQQRKKRRGGLLGFRVLAARAGLSPWHFHRVFRTVTGFTPKAYGDACMSVVKRNPQIPEAVALANAPAQQQQQMRRASVPNLGTGPSSLHSMAAPQQQPQQAPALADTRAGHMVGLGYEPVPLTQNGNNNSNQPAVAPQPMGPTSMPAQATPTLNNPTPHMREDMARYGSGSSTTPVSTTNGSFDIKFEPILRSANSVTPLSQGHLTPVTTMDSMAPNGVLDHSMVPPGYDALTDLNAANMYSNEGAQKSNARVPVTHAPNPTIGHIPLPRQAQPPSMDYTHSDLSMEMNSNAEPPSGMLEDLVGTSQSAFLDDPLMDLSSSQPDLFMNSSDTAMSQWLDPSAMQDSDDPFVAALTSGPVDMSGSLITTSHDNELLVTPTDPFAEARS